MTSQDKFIAWAEKNMPTLHLERSEVSGHFVSPVTGNIFIGWSARDGEVEALNDFHTMEMSGVERAKQDLAEKLGCADEPRWKWLLIGADDLIRERDKLRAECEGLRKDARRWQCVRNAILMQSPYAVWREGSHLVLGKDADDLIDSFLSNAKETSHD